MKLIRNSLWARLVFPLVISGILFWALAAYWYYQLALSTSYASHDYILTSLVNSLSQRLNFEEDKVTIDFPTEIIPILHEAHIDSRFYMIRDSSGKIVAGNANLALPSKISSVTEVLDSELHDAPVRLAIQRTSAIGDTRYCDVAVAETLDGRNLIAIQGLEKLILYGIGILFCTVFFKIWAIRRGLRPLDLICNEVTNFSFGNDKAKSISSKDVPIEVLPLVNAINDLLVRASEDIDNQKRFIGNAAHQLRTPLSGLKVQLALILREKNPEKLSSMIELLQKTIDRTCNLVNKMLSLETARPEALNSSDQECNLFSLTKEALSNLALLAVKKGMDIGIEGNALGADVKGRGWAIQELISNLVENAIIYSFNNGMVLVTIKSSENTVSLCVEDNGPGIPEVERERVFERFYRLSDSPGIGTGLGLAIVKEIAAQHKATVKISAAKGNSGTRVEVIFPRFHLETPSKSSHFQKSPDNKDSTRTTYM